MSNIKREQTVRKQTNSEAFMISCGNRTFLGGNFSTCHDFDNELSTTNKYMMTSYGESFLSLKRLLDYENELVEPLRDCAQGVFLLHVLAIEASIGQAGDERPARHLYRLAANILDVFGPFMNNTRWTKAVEKKPGWNETWVCKLKRTLNRHIFFLIFSASMTLM